MMQLIEEMLDGSIPALAKLITQVEIDSAKVPEIVRLIYPYIGRAYRIGITGPPGSGKSTLVDKLVILLRQQDLSVGIVCVDPTNSYSGGALLGDRIRMSQHYLDNGVFIRSMATRGKLGGLPKTIEGVIKLLDAFGKDVIFIETVGVGQCEIDVRESVDTVVVVLVPGSGDAIQLMKAGLLDIADIVVINKSDYPEVQSLVANLQEVLQPRTSPYSRVSWQIPAIMTEAVRNNGIAELSKQIERHRRFISDNGILSLRRRHQRGNEFMERLHSKTYEALIESLQENGKLDNYLSRVESGEIDPYTAADEAFQASRSSAD